MAALKQKALTTAQNRVITRIKDLHRKRVPLNISAVREKHPDLLLEAYRAKPFWGWKCAIESAGLDYARIKIRLPKKIACKICGIKLRHLAAHIQSAHGMSSTTYRERYRGAELTSDDFRARWSGQSSSDREEAAHQIIPHWEPIWTPEYVLDRLAELRRIGQPLNPSAIEKDEISLYWWTRRYFKKWDIALKAIDVDPKEARLQAAKQKWTRNSVIKALCTRSLIKKPLNWTALTKDDKSLATAARRLFGSYDTALRRAGLDPKTVRKMPVPLRKYKTEEHVISAILRRKLMDRPLNHQAMLEGEDRDVALYMKARRIFGTWKATIEAAELNYENVNLRSHRYKTRKMVISEIKRRHDEDLPLRTTGVTSGKDKDNNLYIRGRHFFKTWKAAVEATGISYRSLSPVKGKYPTPEKLIAEIKRRHKKGLPLNVDAMRKGPHPDHALMTKANRTFGSWQKAIEVAGLNYKKVMKPRGKYPTAPDLLAEIKRRNKTGLGVHANALSRGEHQDKTLYQRGRKEFGSWKKAIKSAGLDYDKISPRTPKYKNKAAVLTEIRRRKRKNLPLSPSGLSKGSHADLALSNQGRRLFGNWQKAIEAAGFDYSKARKCA